MKLDTSAVGRPPRRRHSPRHHLSRGLLLAGLFALLSIPGGARENNDSPEMMPWRGAWRMFGPIASQKDPGKWRPWFEPRLEPTALDGSPEFLEQADVDGVQEQARQLIYDGQELDLQRMWHTNAGQGLLYLYRQEQSDGDALLPVEARARGWLKVWVNGRLAYAGGNDGETWGLHRFEIPLQSGQNTLGFRLAAGRDGWGLALQRGVKMLPPPETIGREVTGPGGAGADAWRVDGMLQAQDSAERLLLSAPAFQAATLRVAAPETGDRLVKMRFKSLGALGRPVECFIALKDGVEVGYSGHLNAETGQYQVIWQVRENGRSVWEIDHRPVTDWAGVSPLADFTEAQAALEQSRMDLDGQAGRAKDRAEQEWIAASRGDEITLRVNGMENLVLRHRIAGSAGRGGELGLNLRGCSVELTEFNAQALPADIASRWALGDDPPVRWEVAHPDPYRTDGGYPVMPGLEPITLYRANPEGWTFCHHAKIASFGGRLYGSWSNSYMHEDSAGTRVRGSISLDGGKTWSPSFVMLPSLSDPADDLEDPHKPGVSIWPNEFGGFLAVEDRVYVLGRAGYRGGYLGQSGQMGFLARQILGVDEMGPVFWLNEHAPRGGEQYSGLADVTHAQLRADGRALLQQLRLPDDFMDRSVEPRDIYRGARPEAVDFSIISHDPIYVSPDGMQVRVWRNYNGTHRIYVSTRHSDTEAWSLAVPTNIPDSPSGVTVGELPDGTVYLIGNQIAGELDDPDARPYRNPTKVWPFAERDFQSEHFPRDPLVLALSRDGRGFDRAWAIRHDTPNARFNGLGWIPGFQYPDAVIANGSLWIIYSVNKEDVEVLEIPLEKLAEAGESPAANAPD
ncbi:MAG: hypothetical protein BWZ08_02478 [candidate division BRC1 bacterium ADurb.BinA292]|nr:MAG: hypothetical protein BWZ08_02478 [candidate division BRC1 bacterium ADurb.BinA292]